MILQDEAQNAKQFVARVNAAVKKMMVLLDTLMRVEDLARPGEVRRMHPHGISTALIDDTLTSNYALLFHRLKGLKSQRSQKSLRSRWGNLPLQIRSWIARSHHKHNLSYR